MFYQTKYGKMNYEVMGCGPIVVFLHGWGQDSSTFNQIYNELKNNYTILVIDLLGFGKSDQPSEPLNLDKYMVILRDLIKHLDIKNPIFIGHSLGGRIAVKYSLCYNDIQRMFLISSAGIRPKRTIRYFFKVYLYKIKKSLYKIFKLKILLNKLQQTSGSLDYINATPIMKKTLSNIVNEDLKHKLKYIKTKTILMWGVHDDITPYSDALVFKNKIKNSTLISFYQSYHFPYITEEGRFIRILKKYLISEDNDGTN